MIKLSKPLLSLGILLLCLATAAASSPASNLQSEFGKAKCENITGIFLQEWVNGERILNSFIKLKDRSEPLNYTAQINDAFKDNAPYSNLEIGCLQNLEGVAIRYENELSISTLIQIDNDGRVQIYPETSAFGINVKKSFQAPN